MKIHGVELERVITRYGRLYVAREDSTIGRSLKLYGEWAEDEINRCAGFLTDGPTIIDVGANIGTHSIALASRFPHSQVIAFEPQPLAFSLLSANVLATRSDNVCPYNLGLSDKEQMVHIAPNYESLEWNVGAFSLSESNESEGGAPPMPLVALDGMSFREPVQFIKIDVEGMEESVLQGASGTIARDRPVIFFELLEIGRLAPIATLLRSLGYDMRWLQTNAYNPRNFRMNAENIWGKGETGVIALPEIDDSRAVDLPFVTGDESQIPVIKYS